MKKILPVNITNHLTTEISNYIRLAVLLSDEIFFSWFIENFIVLFVDKNNFFSDYYPYGWLSARNLYDEVLRSEPFAVTDDILSEIKKQINNEKYVQLYCDKYYIDGSVHYQKQHFLHELLIAGYDDDKELFYFVDLNINKEMTGLHILPYKSLKKSWEAGYTQLQNKQTEELYNMSFMQFDFPVAAISPRKQDVKKAPNLNRIYYALQLCQKEMHFQSEQYNLLSIKATGSAVYEVYYNTLCQKLRREEYKKLLSEYDNIILISLKRLIENKQGHYFRFKYLMDINLIERDSGLLEKMQLIPEKLKIAFNCLAKYSFSFTKPLLDDAAEIFKQMEIVDKQTLDRGVELVGRAIREKYGF